MADRNSCPHCTGARMASGRLESTGKVHFKPDDTRFLTLKTSNVDVTAALCLDCGAISLFGDAEKAADLQPKG